MTNIIPEILWKNCWTHALKGFHSGRKRYLIIEHSEHIDGVLHMMLANDLTGVFVEEAVPHGPKKDGWAGIRHALFSRWRVRGRIL